MEPHALAIKHVQACMSTTCPLAVVLFDLRRCRTVRKGGERITWKGFAEPPGGRKAGAAAVLAGPGAGAASALPLAWYSVVVLAKMSKASRACASAVSSPPLKSPIMPRSWACMERVICLVSTVITVTSTPHALKPRIHPPAVHVH